MKNHTLPPTPQLTLPLLQQIHREVQAACAELAEMLEIGGDIRRIWNQPRRYFVPEIGTCLPFPNGHISRLVEPVWSMTDSDDQRVQSLVQDIIMGVQWWELARREIIPEKFT